MPIDPGIPLGAQGIGPLVNPMALQEQTQKNQLVRLEMQQRQMAMEEARKKQQEDDEYRAAIQSSAGMTSDELLAHIQKNAPGSYLAVSKAISDSQEKAQNAKKAAAEAANHQQTYIGHLADQIDQSDYNPVVLNTALNEAVAQFPEWKPHADQIRQLAMQGKDAVKQVIKPLITSEIRKTNVEQQETAAKLPGTQATSAIQQQVAAGTVGGLTPEQQGQLAKPNETQLKMQYQDLLKKRLLHQPLTQDEQATMASYEQEKLLGPEAAAAAASNRQTRTIEAQMAQQGRTQDFAEKQAGRRELSEKIEQPYMTALNSAQTLRDTVASAQAGNKIGASLQSLETTMAAVRAQGLNRVNMAEIGLPAGAGSSWDRIQGWFGKASAGQPVPADVQKDMLQFADVLEKSAVNKYTQGWQSTTKRYNLTDEKPLVPMGAAPQGPAGPQPPAQPAAQPPAGGRIKVKGPHGESGTMLATEPLPPGWSKIGG